MAIDNRVRLMADLGTELYVQRNIYPVVILEVDTDTLMAPGKYVTSIHPSPHSYIFVNMSECREGKAVVLNSPKKYVVPLSESQAKSIKNL